MSTYQHKELTCVDCRGKFIWSSTEQEFFAEKGFSEPKRCKECRQAKKEQRGGERGGGYR